MMKKRSSVQLDKEFIRELSMLKKYKRETYEDILKRVLKKDLDKVKAKLRVKKGDLQ